MSTAPALPPGRYGTAPAPWRRRVLLVVGLVAAAAALAWLAWASLAAAGQARADTQGYDVVDDATVLVTFSVAKDADEWVECTVEALSAGSAQVGLAVVEVGPADGATSVHTVTLRTQERAVTGRVRDCVGA